MKQRWLIFFVLLALVCLFICLPQKGNTAKTTTPVKSHHTLSSTHIQNTARAEIPPARYTVISIRGGEAQRTIIKRTHIDLKCLQASLLYRYHTSAAFISFLQKIPLSKTLQLKI